MDKGGLPEALRLFLNYHSGIKNHSPRTIAEYRLELCRYLRFLKLQRGLVEDGTDFDEIDIADVDAKLIGSATVDDVYDYIAYLTRRKPEQNNRQHGGELMPATRARKIMVIRSFYKFLTVKRGLLEADPMVALDTPKLKKTQPKYLTLDESRALLSAAEGASRERDLCILTLFLNCGLRISEICGLNIRDVREDHLRVLGKGDKERTVFLNDACAEAINAYLPVRKALPAKEPEALFISRELSRVSRSAVHRLVKKYLALSGLDAERYSAHKLRHTAATLLLQNGVDVRTLQELLGHEHLNTTEIYTHVDSSELRIAAEASPLANFKPEEAPKKPRSGDKKPK